MTEKSASKAVLIDYDDDLFAVPSWLGADLAAAGVAFESAQCRSSAAAVELAESAKVVMIQSVRPLLDADTIHKLTACRCIVRLGIGYDSVDVPAATARGILVCNAPTYCVDDVADHALALLLSATRHIARQDRWIRAGRWDRTGARPSRRLKGCTLGIIAFGRIGRALAERVQGFGMTVLAYDPFLDAEAVARAGARKVELDDLLRKSDFISVHSPLTPETHHLLGRREFDLMKPGAFLVNTSRGPVIDEKALVDALRSATIWGAALDVLETEPLPPDSPLREFENVTFTPHVGANSEESVADLYRIGYRIAVDVCRGRWPEAVVNPSAQALAPVKYARG